MASKPILSLTDNILADFLLTGASADELSTRWVAPIGLTRALVDIGHYRKSTKLPLNQTSPTGEALIGAFLNGEENPEALSLRFDLPLPVVADLIQVADFRRRQTKC